MITFSRVALASAMLLSTAIAQADDGRVAFTAGTVMINGTPAERGAIVNQGDEIRTGLGADALVVMKDKTTMRVASNSSIRIEEYNYEKDLPSTGKVNIALEQGTLRFISGLINKNKPGASSVTTTTASLNIVGSDGTFTYESTSGNFVVQFHRGNGVMRFMDNTGAEVARVSIPTNQRSATGYGQAVVTQQDLIPNAVTTAIANSMSGGNFSTALAEQQAANLSPVDRLVFIAVANTQNGVNAGSMVTAVSRAVTGTGATENAAGAVFVANLLSPGTANATTHASNALTSISGATANDATAIIQAAARISQADAQSASSAAQSLNLLTAQQAAQIETTAVQANLTELTLQSSGTGNSPTRTQASPF